MVCLRQAVERAILEEYFAERASLLIRFYLDPENDLPHIFEHGVTEEEVEQVLRASGADVPGRRGSRMKIGQTSSGRYLEVIYTRDEMPGSVFVVTAYELTGKGEASGTAGAAGGSRDERSQTTIRGERSKTTTRLG